MISIFNPNNQEKKEGVYPAPDIFATCPDEGNILDFYKGQFDAVYILLHPFIKATSIDKRLFCPQSYPSKIDILSGCVPVKWTKVVELTGLSHIDELDIGLRTGILGLKSEVENKEFAAAIDELEETTDIIRPVEGEIPELLQNLLFEAIQQTGHDWLWVGDEFGLERKLFWIDELKGECLIPSHGNLFTSDKSLLLTTHWDSHFSFLCSSPEIIEKILNFESFEGFYCDQSTEVYWSVRNEQNRHNQ